MEKVYKKNNQTGFSHHFLLPLLAILLIGAIGAYLTFWSSAATLPMTVTEHVAKQRGDVEGRLFNGDGGFGVKTKSGTILNFYGDSFVQADPATASKYPKAAKQTAYMMHNNVLITNRTGQVKSVVSGDNLLALKSFIDVPAAKQLPNGSNYYWPSGAAVRMSGTNAGNRIYVSLMRVYSPNDGSGVWNFKTVGGDIALYDLTSDDSLILRKLYNAPNTSADAVPILWSGGVYIENGFLYVLGSYKPSGEYVWGQDLYLSRVPLDKAGRLSVWRYWNGAAWVADRQAAKPIVPNSYGAEATAKISRDSSGYYTFVFKQFSFIGSKIMRATSPSLTGPWTVSTTPVATIEKLNETDFSYSATEVPLYRGGKGVIVSHGNTVWGTPQNQIGIFPVP